MLQTLNFFNPTKKILSGLVLFSLVFVNFAFATGSGSNDDNNKVLKAATLLTDLTQLSRDGRLNEELSYEAETLSLEQMLTGGSKRQPLILDNEGTAGNAIVEQLARRISEGAAPVGLAGKQVLRLEERSITSTAKTEKEAAEKINEVIKSLAESNDRTILFIENAIGLLNYSSVNQTITSAVEAGKLTVVASDLKTTYADVSSTYPETLELFEILLIETKATDATENKAKEVTSYRGDNVSSDLRELIANDPSSRVDVIIQAKDANNAALRALLQSGEARIASRVGSTDTLVVNLPASTIEILSTSGLINYVSPDRATSATGHVSETTGLTAARNLPGSGGSTLPLEGNGIGIAIVDSGIDANHTGFAGRIKANVNFTDSGLGDRYGHGTHVAGLAAGRSPKSSGAYHGIARGANIISVKVLNDQGVGQTSWLLNGLDWILQNRQQHNIRVVNLSLGTLAVDSYHNDPLCLKVKELSDAGIVVVAAAGNLGRGTDGSKLYGTIHSPGNSPYAITVGATNSFGTDERSDDSITTYSSRGPSRSSYLSLSGVRVYDNVMKPELAAPGNEIISHKAQTTASRN